MIMLMDHIKSKSVPPGLRCRQVLPSSGLRSSSLWDVPDVQSLQVWLDEFLDVDCTSEVFEVQEEFALGLSKEIVRMRAAEKVADRAKEAASSASHSVTEFDAKFKVSENAAQALKAAKDGGTVAATRTKEAFTKVGSAARTGYSKALENEHVSAAAAALNKGFTAGWNRLSSISYFRKESDDASEGDADGHRSSTDADFLMRPSASEGSDVSAPAAPPLAQPSATVTTSLQAKSADKRSISPTKPSGTPSPAKGLSEDNRFTLDTDSEEDVSPRNKIKPASNAHPAKA